MFEKTNLSAFDQGLERVSETAVDVDLRNYRANGAGASNQAVPLRAIEWSELTARLSAARDLRRVLRAEGCASAGFDASGGETAFADAAARFFRANEEDQRAVNHKGLEPCKTSSGMYPIVTDAPTIEIPTEAPIPTGDADRAMRKKSDD